MCLDVCPRVHLLTRLYDTGAEHGHDPNGRLAESRASVHDQNQARLFQVVSINGQVLTHAHLFRVTLQCARRKHNTIPQRRTDTTPAQKPHTHTHTHNPHTAKSRRQARTSFVGPRNHERHVTRKKKKKTGLHVKAARSGKTPTQTEKGKLASFTTTGVGDKREEGQHGRSLPPDLYTRTSDAFRGWDLYTHTHSITTARGCRPPNQSRCRRRRG